MTGDRSFGRETDPFGDLVPGALRGYRSFTIEYPKDRNGNFRCASDIDDLGVLAAVSANVQWKTDMVADCVELLKKIEKEQRRARVDELRRYTLGGHISISGQQLSWSAEEELAPSQSPEEAIVSLINAHGDTPNRGCSCGIYGWYSPWQAMTKHFGQVIAVTENTGKIVMGTLGYRTEKSKIVAVCPSPIVNEIRFEYSYVNMPDDDDDLLYTYSTNPGIYSASSIRNVVRGAVKSYVTEKMLNTITERYPGVVVYPGIVSMVNDYPPDLDTPTNLGIKTRLLPTTAVRSYLQNHRQARRVAEICALHRVYEMLRNRWGSHRDAGVAMRRFDRVFIDASIEQRDDAINLIYDYLNR